MRLGLPISLLLHALILAWGLIAMKSTRDFKKIEPVSIALEIISEGELAQMRKGDEKSKEKELEAVKDSQSQAQKETPKPKPVAAQPPPPPPKPPEPVKEEPKPEDVLKEMAKTEPKPPEVKPEPPKPPEPKPEADDALAAMKDNQPKPPPVPPPKPPEPPKAAEKKPVPPKPKPTPPPPKVAEQKTAPVQPGKKPSTFDAQQIAALIDKSPNAAPAPASTASPAPTQKASRTAAGVRDGTGPKLSQNEQQALVGRLVAQIERCWRPPTGIPDAKSAIPVISFKLQRDGSVVGSPTIVNRQGSPSFQLASEAATRAIMQCQPYDMPADKYDGGWSEVELNFDPRGMF